ncbi:MAG: thiosulfate sulfurtransferase [Leptospiraceae bacterium]|nr:thiosulfate sulfurtransferase [Leptospiraceae bacterium]MCP5513178.1 thiosulfate sulfurtransferase [Leptospiraceae bacterium]
MSNWGFLKNELDSNDFVIDCRSQALYEAGTIKGAYYFPFIKKAFGSDNESQKKMLGHLRGIQSLFDSESKTRIIVFDEGMGMFAARMVYLLRGVGIKETYMLSKRWPFEADLEAGTKIMEFEPIDKAKQINGVVDKAFMEKNLTRLQIFDTRTKDEYDGKLPRMTNPEQGTLCGRLPGAFLWDWTTFFNSEGYIMDKSIFTKRLQGFPFMPERTTVLYDYNGSRSCLLALMLKEVGYQDVSTYQGSWFEWRKSSLPKQAVSLYGVTNKTTAAPRVGGSERKS